MNVSIAINIMHIPTSALNLKDLKFPQIRCGLQGPSGVGKSYLAMTMPNPIPADLDGSLTAHSGKDIPIMPFYSAEFLDTYEGGKFKPPKNLLGVQHNRRDAFLHFLQYDAMKLTNEQTLIVDSWTSLQLAFDMQQDLEPKRTKEGNIDDFDFWKKKIEYSEKVLSYLMSIKCHVIVTFHEDPVRDKITGQLVDKIAPLMQGKFVAQLKRYFTDFFRVVSVVEKDNAKPTEKNDPKYYVQVKSDNKFDVKTRLDVRDCPSFIDVTDGNLYEQIFSKYMPKDKLIPK